MIPNCRTYDPTYGHEVAVIVQDGLKRMFSDKENCFYYLTLMILNPQLTLLETTLKYILLNLSLILTFLQVTLLLMVLSLMLHHLMQMNITIQPTLRMAFQMMLLQQRILLLNL